MNLIEIAIKPLPTLYESMNFAWGNYHTSDAEECVRCFLREIYHPTKETMGMVNSKFIQVVKLDPDDLPKPGMDHEVSKIPPNMKMQIVEDGKGFGRGYSITRGYFHSSDPLGTFIRGFTSFHLGTRLIDYVYDQILKHGDYIHLELTFNEE
jgi:hypothetical protein